MLRSLKIKALACVAKDQRVFIWPSEKRRSGASDHQKKKKKNHGKKMGITRPRPDGGVTRKAPGGINPAVVLSALGVQNILRPGKSW